MRQESLHLTSFQQAMSSPPLFPIDVGIKDCSDTDLNADTECTEHLYCRQSSCLQPDNQIQKRKKQFAMRYR